MKMAVIEWHAQAMKAEHLSAILHSYFVALRGPTHVSTHAGDNDD
jgi:hypothetical protein